MAIEPNWYEINKAIHSVSDSLRYPFVHSCYPMLLFEIIPYLNRLVRAGPLHRQDAYADFLTGLFDKWLSAGVVTLPQLSARCASREQVEASAAELKLPISEIHASLHFCAYSLLPRNFYLRDLIEKGDAEMGAVCAILRKAGYPNTLDLLEKARTRKGRAALSIETGVPERAIEALVHRADLTRMSATAGNMVRIYMNAGVTSLEILINLPPEDLGRAVKAYLAATGKVPKYGKDLLAAQAQAKVLPLVVEP